MKTLFYIAVIGSALVFSGIVSAAEAPPAPKPAEDMQLADNAKADNTKADNTKDGDSDKDITAKEKNNKKPNKGKAKDSGKEKEDDDSRDAKEADDVKINDSRVLSESMGDSRIKLLLYDETDVYTITTKYGYQTNIVFSPAEEIELISVGDRSLWQIIPSGNRMFIRPMEEGVVTNMTVLTNKHSYQFDLKSVAGDKTSGNIYVAKFIYENPKKEIPASIAASLPGAGTSVPASSIPASSPFGIGPSIPAQPSAVMPNQTSAAAPQPQVMPYGTASAQPAYPNYNYTYAGADDLAPLQVYDDGKFTYLKYRNVSQLLPNIFIVDPSGTERPVSYNIKGDFVVIDAVAGEMVLKNRDNTLHIFNEVLNPG